MDAKNFDDVKLAGDNPSEQIRASRRADDKWDVYLQNGNIARAQKIGATLGGIIAGIHSEDENEDTAVCLRPVLKAFASVAAIESGLPDKLLVRVALNVFYDVIKKENPHLYEKMGSSGAFTFFYLAWRRPGDRYHHVAETFAMLAGQTDDADYITELADSFTRDLNLAENAVGEVVFE